MRSAMEWAQVRALAADGVSKRQIAARLGINRRTVDRLVAAPEPPRYRRAPRGSMLDPFEPVLRRLLEEWPEIKAPRVTEILRADYGYEGSVDLVKKRLARMRPSRRGRRSGRVIGRGRCCSSIGPRCRRRPKIAGRERRVYALIASLPFSGAQTAHFSFDLTAESFLEGHVRALEWLGGVPRECVYDNLRSVVARRDGDQVIQWNQRFVALRGHYAFHATACTPATPREKGSVEGSGPLPEDGLLAGAPDHRPRGSGRAIRRLARARLQPAPPRDRRLLGARAPRGRAGRAAGVAADRFDYAGRRSTRVPLDGYLKLGGSFYRAPEPLVHQRVELRFDRDRVWICHRGEVVARYLRSYDRGLLVPAAAAATGATAPAAPVARLVAPEVAPPELADYAELCA